MQLKAAVARPSYWLLHTTLASSVVQAGLSDWPPGGGEPGDSESVARPGDVVPLYRVQGLVVWCS